MPLPWNPGVDVCHRANGWLAIYKPAGLQSHPNADTATERAHSILNAPWDATDEAYILPDGSRLWLCHRLDSPTSGLLLLALDPTLASRAREAFAAGAVEKTYHAIVLGVVRVEPGIWRDSLRRNTSGKSIRIRIAPSGLTAVTAVRSLRSTRRPAPLTLLELQPHTGRTHQLRVQAAARRLPILGDRTYGDFRQSRLILSRTGLPDRLYLHASGLRIADPSLDLPHLQIPPPVDWPLLPDEI